MPNVDNPPKSKEKDAGKEKKSKNSFFQSLKEIFTGGGIGKSEEGKIQESSEATTGKPKDKTPVKDKISTSPQKEKTEKKAATKTEKKAPEDQEEEQALSIIEDIKSHEIAQWLRKRKEKVIKAVAITISAILIIIAIIYSLTPTEQVASNVVFGEGAMFSVFLVMVAFLILAAVFASRLLEGKYLKDIHKDLEIVEGKREKDDHKGKDNRKSNHDPIIERMNKKDK